jgi:CheY-like chemotaxis protein
VSQVLLADDDQDLREALQTVLTNAGHDVTVADNGLAEVMAALTVAPQVIVTDVHMPVLAGTDAVSILRAIPEFSRIPVVFMSGDTPGVSTARWEGHLRKPFDPCLLLNTVARLASESREAREEPDPASGARARPLAEPAEPRNAGSTEPDVERVIRALVLIGEQDRRVARLEGRGAELALAVELYRNLINSLVVLAGFVRGRALFVDGCPPATIPGRGASRA